MRLRIAMLCHNYPPHTGGLEVMVQSLSRELARRHHVAVVTSAWGDAEGDTDEDGIMVLRLPAAHFLERFGVPYPVPTGRHIGTALRTLRNADVIHVHGALYATSVLGALVAGRRAKPLIVTEHVGFVTYETEVWNRIEHAAWSLIGDRVIQCAARVTTYNDRVQAWLRMRYPYISVDHIVNGVDPSAFQPSSADDNRAARAAFGLPAHETLALFVGRDSPKKNLKELLAVQREGYRLVVCGAERSLALPNVIDLGIVPHSRMPLLYRSVDLMVLPSTGEGFPLAAQEAMSSGVPLVVLWDSGYSGSLSREVVAACNSMEEVHQKVRALVSSPSLRKQVGSAGQRWSEEHWSWPRTADRFDALYRHLLTKGRPDVRTSV